MATLKHLGRNADKHSCRLFSFITAHKRSCVKVMFLHLSVNRVGGVSVRETPCTVKSGRYASYWNAFLFHGRITYGTVIYIQLSIFSDLLLKYEVNHRPYPLQPRGLINRGNWCYVNAVSFGQITLFWKQGSHCYWNTWEKGFPVKKESCNFVILCKSSKKFIESYRNSTTNGP